jgi:hypothetical protein
MTNDLQLLREFRSEIPAPSEATRLRIYAFATADTRTRLDCRRWRVSSFALAPAAAAAALAVLLVSPWSGSDGGFVQRALAAIGTGPVLHVITETTLPPDLPPYHAVSLPSGTPIETTARQEIWFDQNRELKKTVLTDNGALVAQELETPQGGFISDGNPLHLCFWNAGHRRYSCTATNTNPTGPNVPGPPPTLETALVGFIDHYQSALASGEATKTGTGQIGGRQVIWLRIRADDKDNPLTEDVAVDASTYAPVLIRTVGTDEPVQFTVIQIDTQAYDPSLFSPPAREYPPLRSTTEATTPIDAAEASDVLGGNALWLGPSWNGYQLVKVEEQKLVDAYASQSGKQPTQSMGVVFTYAPPGGSADSADVLQIKQATQCEVAWQMICDPGPPPKEGVLLLGQGSLPSITVRDGIYVAISQSVGQPDLVSVANALSPVDEQMK